MPETWRIASSSDDDAPALRLVALLNDDQVLEKPKSVFYLHALDALIYKIDGLKQQITKKNEIIEDFEKRLRSLEAESDR